MFEGLKPGDDVQHKSGGPKMTYVGPGGGINGDEEVVSYWDERKKEFVRETFPLAVLTKWAPPSGPRAIARG
jgi:hypothetical protein